jgi:hypothetical protein
MEEPTKPTKMVMPVVVVDVDMSMWSMIVFLVRLAIAAIPAAIIIAIVYGLGWGLFFAIISGGHH